MPVVSVFFGIVIRMFYREHGVAHFHAEYQGQQATFTFGGSYWPVRSGHGLRSLHQGMGGRAPAGVGGQLESPGGGGTTREDPAAGLRRRITEFLPLV
jgi:hypothetical protein